MGDESKDSGNLEQDSGLPGGKLYVSCGQRSAC